METYRFRIVLIHYLKNLCNLRNLWIKCLFDCGFAALCTLGRALSFPASTRLPSAISGPEHVEGSPSQADFQFQKSSFPAYRPSAFSASQSLTLAPSVLPNFPASQLPNFFPLSSALCPLPLRYAPCSMRFAFFRLPHSDFRLQKSVI